MRWFLEFVLGNYYMWRWEEFYLCDFDYWGVFVGKCGWDILIGCIIGWKKVCLFEELWWVDVFWFGYEIVFDCFFW